MILTLLTAATLTHANPYVTKIHKGHDKSYGKYEISYPRFNAAAAPAYRRINAAIVAKVKAAHCDADSAQPDMEYNESIEVKTITPDFVALKDQSDGSCGGAHPWSSRDGLLFDARTGAEIEARVEMGEPSLKGEWSDADSARYEQAHQRMVKFVASHLSTEDARCFNEENGLPDTPTLEEALAGVSFNYGLERGAVVIYGEPPHVIQVCSFEISAPYAEIKDLIAARSPLHQWLTNR